MSLSALVRAGRSLSATSLVCATASLIVLGSIHAQPGLDAPEAIGPYLNGNFPATEPSNAGEWAVQETYTGININLPMHLTPYPGTNKLLCVAKEGRIFLFEDNAAASTTETFLDLRTRTFTSSDCGMTWLVFHPQFGTAGNPNRGYVYVTYKWAPSTGGDGHQAYWRLSRFTVPDGSQAADPASELVMIQQYDRQEFHDSGCMLFGPDGYLYVAVGDEGGANDQYNVGQKINERLFSGILRIDVDNKPGNQPVTTRRQPLQIARPTGWPVSYTTGYSIPADNPFITEGKDYLEEFYALGLRQPYRISYDASSNTTWIGESGQDTSEELCILAPGANYGWPFREGSVAGPKAQPAVIHGTLTEPVWDVLHSSGPDGCLVGGFVYRGAAHPDLTGKYLTVDNVSGRIRSFTLAGNAATATRLADMPSGSVYSGTSTIGKDTTGEPVFIKINGTGSRGRFMKLAMVPAATTNPVWYRFEDQHPSNSSGYVSANPGHATVDVIDNGIAMLAADNGTTSANVRYSSPNGLSPAGATANSAGVRIVGTAGTDGYPGNARGALEMSENLGRLDDFTIELSFKPAAGTLGSGYQCFLGLDGTTGVVPNSPAGAEAGTPIQPFRLMRWGRNDALANPGVPLDQGDLFLNVRVLNPANQQWRSLAIEVFDDSTFTTADRWYHLAIVGRVSTGTLTVFSYENGSYVQRGQATGYTGNLQPGTWTIGRGMFNGNLADWVTDTTFDEVRIANVALPQNQFLYATLPWQPVVVVANPPRLLSETGAFADLTSLTPAPGVILYDVNSPLWSDAAAKLRWIALPNDGTHDTPQEKIGFDPEGPWSFPAGTVFIKHFELPVDDADPSIRRRLETRFIVMPQTGEPYGVTYKWRADGSDAELLPGGLSESITIAEAGGGTRVQQWDYPSRTDCRVCHNANAGHVLGLKTWQLNGDTTYDRTGRTANQLETLGSLGWFDSGYRPEHLPWFLKGHRLDDTSASLEVRVRSYLDSNCSQCHQPDGVRARFDARFSTQLASQGLIHGPLVEPADEEIVMPGDLAHSMLRIRHSSTGPLKMPPLAKNVVDAQAAQVISDWILSLPAAPGVELVAPASAEGDFTVAVRFSEAVTGLSAADFSVGGGDATGLTGSGADYVLTIAPRHGARQVTLGLPANAAQANGHGNYASATHTVTISDPGLLAWLKLDETAGSSAIDSSPQENHATLVDMEAGDRIPGKFGGALRFDSTDERVTMANVAPNDFTVSFWMRTTRAFPVTANPPSGIAIINADSGGPTNDYLIAGTRENGISRISFQTGNAAGTPNMILHATSPVNTGDWVHVACTRVKSSGEMKIYINGVLEATRTGSLDTLGASPVLVIGATPGSAATSYEGDLDQIRIHGRALAAAEVTDLFLESDALPPYAQWLADHLPGLSHLHGDDADPDHDGTGNFGEFAFGGDPLSPGVFPVPLNRAADGTVTLSYRARRAPAGAIYQVQVGDDLTGWTAADPDITSVTRTPLADTDYETVTVTYLPPEQTARLFFRIRARPE
ncbi:PQQ-dependent sugar dehydrogenase [Luteolibacter flavescens]|uniref:PQQ-dependent sugar dehydrogenase n=1 Tax=Luteolibacter flavescens TaxID=1859460 RepID=A0ABT3FKV9_9BACT|nr:LamG-like jellyroll fold domain-containing protein [Luteolibacter flavescens]MCW1884191.1 PQQ-dependent sugar dehydrogenase [Luteolibacter flavescens]